MQFAVTNLKMFHKNTMGGGGYIFLFVYLWYARLASNRGIGQFFVVPHPLFNLPML